MIPARLSQLWRRRSVHGALAAALAAGLVAQAIARPSTWPWLVALLLIPDLPLLAGMNADGVKGRLRPAAVPYYNALHAYTGPIAAAAGSLLLGPAMLTAGLAWALHVAVDRALGFGLRTPAGDQRA